MDLHQIDVLGFELLQGGFHGSLTRFGIRGHDLGGQEQALPVVQVGDQIADDPLGPAIQWCGVDDGPSLHRQLFQNGVQRRDGVGALDVVFVGAHPDDRNLLAR